MTDLVLADVDIEWMVHLPLVLHVAVLGTPLYIAMRLSMKDGVLWICRLGP